MVKRMCDEHAPLRPPFAKIVQSLEINEYWLDGTDGDAFFAYKKELDDSEVLAAPVDKLIDQAFTRICDSDEYEKFEQTLPGDLRSHERCAHFLGSCASFDCFEWRDEILDEWSHLQAPSDPST
jgi:hypothetical protein